MQTESSKLSIGEKIGYSLGDSAANFIFQTMLILQLSAAGFWPTMDISPMSNRPGKPCWAYA